MKLRRLFAAVFAMLAIVASPTLSAHTKCNNDKPSDECCVSPCKFIITPKDIARGLVIKKSGTWCLKDDSSFCPRTANQVAITIDASDVILDLNTHRLFQANTVANTIAIDIKGGHHNITIQNGTIEKFTRTAINSLIQANAPGLSELKFANLNIHDNGTDPMTQAIASGISLTTTDIPPIVLPPSIFYFKNIIIENCHVNRNVFVGIDITQASDIIMSNSETNDNFLATVFPDAFIAGTKLRNSKNIRMTNCSGNRTRFTDPNGSQSNQIEGLRITNCENALVQNCQFNDTFGESCILVGGMNSSNTRNAIFENVQFNNHSGGSGVAIVNGVHQSDAANQLTDANGIKFINCQSNGNTRASTGTIAGNVFLTGFFMITTKNLIFERCQTVQNQTTYPNLATVSGFFVGSEKSDPATADFGSVRNISFIDCVSQEHSGPLNVIGFSVFAVGEARDGVAGNLINVVCDNCIASRMRSTNANARGISLSLSAAPPSGPYAIPSNIAVTNCRVSDIRTLAAVPGATTSAGIFLQSTKQPVVINNSVTDCDVGILLTGSNALNPTNRFQLAQTATPTVPIDLTSVPAGSPVQTFTNVTRGNSITVTVSATTVNLLSNIITSPVNLNTVTPPLAGWQIGDIITYNPGNVGTAIGGLTNNTNYALIAFSPGFTENAVIQDNEVNQCSVAGYREIRTQQATYPPSPFTTSAWINNFAFNNGPTGGVSDTTNYNVPWSGVPPIISGNLANYPTGSQKAFNISLLP